MALLYPWATKEYLLWHMSLAQIILYHNLGIELKYPDPNRKDSLMQSMTKEERQAAREEARRIMAEAKAEEDRKRSEDAKAGYREKYGAI